MVVVVVLVVVVVVLRNQRLTMIVVKEHRSLSCTTSQIELAACLYLPASFPFSRTIGHAAHAYFSIVLLMPEVH